MAGRGRDDSDDSWLVTIPGFDKGKFEDVKSSFRRPRIGRNPTTTIYFVPDALYRLKPEAYRSRFMSLAVHYKFDTLFRDGFKIKNQHVLYHVQSILNRNEERRFEDYLKAMNEMRDRIADCHMEGCKIDFNRLLIAVSSGCFIVDTLLLFYDGRLTTAVDSVCASRFQYLWMDLLLLANQIPFFLLQRVYDLVLVTQGHDLSPYPSLVDLCLHFFNPFLEINKLPQRPLLMESESIHHLLHLVHHYLLPCHQNYPPKLSSSPFHRFFQSINLTNFKKRLWPSSAASNPIPSVENNTAKRLTIKPIPSAKRLQDAGIKLKKTEAQGFCNISFNRRKGVLEIPYLHIDSNTEILLRNLVAWEQCHPETLQYFTGYAIFMDYIVNSAKDVEILLQSGIIEQSLGSDEEVASIFNGLSTNLVYEEDNGGHLPALCRHINEYCRNDFNIWRAKLMTDYFSSPWTIVSLIAAFILLLLTLAQTFFSAFSYFRPP